MTTRRTVVAVLVALVAVALTAPGVLGPVSGTAAAAERGSVSATVRSEGTGGGKLGGAVDRLVKRQLAEHRIPGASVVVVSGGRQVLARGYGVADAGRDEKVTADRTGFFMASVAKVFTATAVLQLAERGKLELDADVNRYLRDFSIDDGGHRKPVRVSDLLTHTAGFDSKILGTAEDDPEDVGELGESLAEHQPNRVRPPGEAASYDNYGFALAGHLVENVSGQTFEDYVAEHILTPLGMSRTGFAQPQPARVADGLARGHRPDGDGQATARGQYGAWSPTGAGAVTTATDMGQLLRALLNGGVLPGSGGDGGAGVAETGRAGERVLREKTVRTMFRRHFGNHPELPGMAYALEERRRDGHRMLVKDGDLPGFHTNMALLPDREAGVFVAYNGDGESGAAAHAADELVRTVADHYHGGGAAKDEPAYDATASHEPTDSYTGYYRAAGTHHSDLTRAAALTGSVHVTGGADGTLTTSGPLSGDPDVTEQHWVPLGDGVFQERDGQDRIAFRDGRLSVASAPSMAYQQVDWYESPALHLPLLVGGLAVLVLSSLGWLITALVRAVRRRERAPLGARLARLLAWLTGGLVVAAAGCFAMLVADPNAMNQTIMLGDSPLLTLVPLLLQAAAVSTAGVLCCAVLCWCYGWWGRGWKGVASRVHYCCTAVGAVLLLSVSASYQLVI